MTTLELITLVLGGAFVIYLLCNISYSIGLSHGITYITNLLRKESEDEE